MIVSHAKLCRYREQDPQIKPTFFEHKALYSAQLSLWELHPDTVSSQIYWNKARAEFQSSGFAEAVHQSHITEAALADPVC